MDGVRTALSAMDANQQQLDLISNNIANVNTPGFKPSDGKFSDLIYERIGGGNDAAAQVTVGRGAALSSVERSDEQGALEQTGVPTDFAITGEGFFQVRQPNGQIAFTRNGSFQLDGLGRIVGSNGEMLDPQITVPQGATDFTVAPTGQVTATLANGTVQQIGQLRVAVFQNPSGLQAIGGSMFVPTGASGQPNLQNPGAGGAGTVNQGSLEASATDLGTEMTALIEAQRGFEFMSRLIATGDQMDAITNQMRAG